MGPPGPGFIPITQPPPTIVNPFSYSKAEDENLLLTLSMGWLPSNGYLSSKV